MPLLGHYTTGTVTVAANGTAVTGVGTNWIAGGVREGDVFVGRGLSVTILSVNSATSITLALNWPGAALSASAYEIRPTPDASRVLMASREAITLFGDNAAAIANAQLRKNNLTATRAPVATDDSAQGYAIGSRWMWGQDEWVATSVAPGAASWKADGGGGGDAYAYPAFAAFQAATIPSSVQLVDVVNAGGEIIGYRRQSGANGPEDIQHPNGSTWAKATVSEGDILAAVTDVASAVNVVATGAGSFVPTLVASTGTLLVSGGTVEGRWNRIANLIFYSVSIVGVTVAANGSSGNVLIGGFPLPATPNARDSGFVRRSSGITWAGTGGLIPAFTGFATVAGAYHGILYANFADGQAPRTVQVPNLATGAGAVTLQFSGWYEVAG